MIASAFQNTNCTYSMHLLPVLRRSGRPHCPRRSSSSPGSRNGCCYCPISRRNWFPNCFSRENFRWWPWIGPALIKYSRWRNRSLLSSKCYRCHSFWTDGRRKDFNWAMWSHQNLKTDWALAILATLHEHRSAASSIFKNPFRRFSWGRRRRYGCVTLWHFK